MRKIALEGVRQLLKAAITAEDAARVAQRQLNDLAAQARAGSMVTEHLGDADKLVLAQAAVSGGPPGTNSILSETDAERAALRTAAHHRRASRRSGTRQYSGVRRPVERRAGPDL